MGTPAFDPAQLQRIAGRIGDAAVDPSLWPDIMEGLCSAVHALGAGLLQSDIRTPDIPRTAGVDQAFRAYFANRWHMCDVRAERAVPLLLHGAKVVIDQDIFSPEEMRSLPYNADYMASIGLHWFAVVGFQAGPAYWGLSIQRSASQGPFEPDEKRALAALSPHLSAAATLSHAVGKSALSGITNALSLVGQPALALDRMGFVLEANAKAEQIFDDDVRVCNRRLVVRDQRAKTALETLIDQLRTTPDTAALSVKPISVARRTKRSLLIRILPVDGPARSPFLGARALLVFSDLEKQWGPQPHVLAQTFGLSPAESRLAALIATGISPECAAERLGLARETVRTQLKAVFQKTETHRQSELIALLSRLSED